MRKRIRELAATILVICIMMNWATIKTYAVDGTVNFDINYPGGPLDITIERKTIVDIDQTTINPSTIELTSLGSNSDQYEFLGWYGYYGESYNHFYGTTGTVNTAHLFPNGINSSTLTAGWVQRIPIDMPGTTDRWYRVDAIPAPTVENYELVSWTLGNHTITGSTGSNVLDLSDVSGENSNVNILLNDLSVSANDINNVTAKWKPKNGKLVQITNGTKKTLSVKGTSIGPNLTVIVGPVEGSFVDKDEKYNITINLPDSTNTYAEYSAFPGNNNNTVEVYPVTLSSSNIERYLTVVYQDSDPYTKFQNSTPFKYTGDFSKTITEIAGTSEDGATRPGYTLIDWNYVLDKTGSVVGESKLPDGENTENTTLTCTPVWGGTISFDPRYPEGNDGITTDSFKAETGFVIEFEKEFEKEFEDTSGEYVFLGWSESESATEPDYTDTYTVEGDITLYGVWGPASYTLTWKDYSDGVDFEPQTYSSEVLEYGSSIALPSDPQKEGYTFLGWNGYGSVYWGGDMSVRYKNGDKFSYTMPAQNAEMSAYWEINSYKLNYDGNGTSTGVPTESEEIVYKNTATVSSIEPIRAGYTFSGWSDGTNTYQPGATFSMPARNVTLTAQWKPNRHNVTYDGDGATSGVPDSHEADYDSSVTAGSGPKKDGYVFSGWEQISTGKTISAGGAFLMPDMDETLKAKWQIAYSKMGKGTFYLVKGQNYSMGGTLKVSGDTSVYSSGITFYVPSSGNYTFE